MRTDHCRGIPVPAAERCTTAPAAAATATLRCGGRRFHGDSSRVVRSRPDVHSYPGPEIEALQVAFLGLRVNRGRVFGVDAALEAVTAADVVPVAGADAGPIRRARRTLH